MAKNGKQKGRGLLIALAVVAAAVVLLWFVALPLVNTKAEEYVNETVRDMFAAEGITGTPYRTIRIDAVRGLVEVTDLSVSFGDSARVRAQSIALTVSPTELVSFGLGRNSGLSKAGIEATGVSYADRDRAVSSEHADITAAGLIDMSLPASSVIRTLSVDAEGVSYVDPSRGFSCMAKQLSLDVAGEVTAASLEKGIAGLPDDVASLDMAVSKGKIVPDGRLAAQLDAYAAVSPWLVEEKNWTFDYFSVQARSLERNIVLDSVQLNAPLIEASGNASIPRNIGSNVIEVRLAVRRLNDQVRAELEPLLLYVGQTIPDGAFTVDAAWMGQGMPRLVIH